MSAPAPTTDNRPAGPKKKPGWMSIPGGPKEPKRDEFRNQLQKASADKSKLFDRLKEIKGEFEGGDAGGNDIVNKERQQLRSRMNEIDAERRKERDSRKEKDTEIKKIRDKRREIENKLKDLSDDLGSFRSVRDIEEAIDRIMYKMETGGGGGLSSEKNTLKKLQQLEQAKTLLLELEPLQNQINDAEDQEAEMMQEYREIHERIGKLNKDYEENFSKKSEKDKSVKKNDNRGALIKEREDIRAKLNTVNEQMDKLRTEFDAQQKAWNDWRDVAQEKYKVKIEAERKERQDRWDQREKERKLARKKTRMLKKLNPFEGEIAACSTLITYLEDRKKMMARDKERAEVQKKLATFDPSAGAPKGAVLKVSEDDWLYADRTGKNSKKAQKPQKKPEPKKDAPKKENEGQKKEKFLQHSTEKHRLFEITKTEAPLNSASIEDTVKALREKKKEYESHIKSDADIEAMTSEEDEEEEEEAAAAPAEETKEE